VAGNRVIQVATETLDPDFGRHLNDAIASHREGITPPAWD